MADFSTLLSQIKFNADGLVAAVAQCADSGTVLMMAWMNEESLRRSFATGEVHYWSRSRKCLWRKGETSGHKQALLEMRVDCDGDTLLLTVRQTGAACHTGAFSCFFRSYDAEQDSLRDDSKAGETA